MKMTCWSTPSVFEDEYIDDLTEAEAVDNEERERVGAMTGWGISIAMHAAGACW